MINSRLLFEEVRRETRLVSPCPRPALVLLSTGRPRPTFRNTPA